jgi:hypothetical protein
MPTSANQRQISKKQISLPFGPQRNLPTEQPLFVREDSAKFTANVFLVVSATSPRGRFRRNLINKFMDYLVRIGLSQYKLLATIKCVTGNEY